MFSTHTCAHVQIQSLQSLRPMDWSPSPLPRLLCLWVSPGKNTGVGYYYLLQGIFPTQGLNWCLFHCRQIPYCLSHQGSLSQNQEVPQIKHWTFKNISRWDILLFLLSQKYLKYWKEHLIGDSSEMIFNFLISSGSCSAFHSPTLAPLPSVPNSCKLVRRRRCTFALRLRLACFHQFS